MIKTRIKKYIFAFFLNFSLIFLGFQSFAQNNLDENFTQDLEKEIGITSLMRSTASNDIEGIKFFLKISPLSIDKRNIGGATALHIAIRNNNYEAVKLLLDYGANVDIKDNDGYTPLMRAISYSNPEIVSLILEKNPDISALNQKFESAIIVSAVSSCDECLKMVLYKVIPDRNISLIELKSQIKQAFLISNWKNNNIQKKILNDFYDKLVSDYEKQIYRVKEPENKSEMVMPKLHQEEIKYKFIKNSEPQTQKSKKYILKKSEKGVIQRKPQQKKYIFNGQKKKYQPRKTYEFKSEAFDNSNITIEPNPVGQNKTIVLDGQKVISKDLDNNVELDGGEVRKTFIIK